MELGDELQPTATHLLGLLRNASLIQARQYFGEPSVERAEAKDLRLGQVLKRYMAMVILNSADLRIVFKVHFDPEQIRRQRESRQTGEPHGDDRQIIDFVKELANQIGGRVCRAFDADPTPMGMSVPLCTRGVYEIYADYKTRMGTITRFGDFWQLEGTFDTLYCSCYIELGSRRDFTGITCELEGADEGELDFL